MSPEYRALTRIASQHDLNADRLAKAAADTATAMDIREKYAVDSGYETLQASKVREELAAMRAAALQRAA